MTSTHAPHHRPAPAPRVQDVARDVLRRAIAPALVAFVLLYGIGLLIMGPLDKIPAEEGASRWFEAQRTPALDTLTHVWSTSNDTWWTIGLTVLLCALVLAVTRKWWLAMVPGLAVILESSVFVAVTTIVGRPRPQVEMLDPAPPTSSYPSGHTAAAMALYVSLALLAQRIRTPWLRHVVTTVCLVWPVGVGVCRLYRGMHHVSDVLIGAVFGIWCAVAAYGCGVRADRPADRRWDASP